MKTDLTDPQLRLKTIKDDIEKHTNFCNIEDKDTEFLIKRVEQLEGVLDLIIYGTTVPITMSDKIELESCKNTAKQALEEMP